MSPPFLYGFKPSTCFWGLGGGGFGVNVKKIMIRLYHSILSISIYDLKVSEMFASRLFKRLFKTKKDKNTGMNIF